jgi:amino acid transporter
MVVTWSLVCASLVLSVIFLTSSQARVNQEIARQGFLPYGRFLSSSEPFGAPMGGLIVQ